MWFFRSPEIVFGEDALEYLAGIQGHKALIVTDVNMVALGFVDKVKAQLSEAGIEAAIFAEVEPNPSLLTVTQGGGSSRGLRTGLDHRSGRRICDGRGQGDLCPVRATRAGAR
jgi:alcohol dehydrogenase class IV